GTLTPPVGTVLLMVCNLTGAKLVEFLRDGWIFLATLLVALLLVTFTLFRPGFWWDMVYPPFDMVPAAQMNQLIEEAPANSGKRLWIEGVNMNGDDVRKGVLLPLGPQAPARERLTHAGVSVVAQGDELLISGVKFGSAAEKLGMEQGFRIVSAEVPADRPVKEWMYLPALALLALVMALQRSRLRVQGRSAAQGKAA
ncbi:MAG: DUF3394 domain-containing protein, partial [Hydrogenophaga sp.]